MYIEITPTTPLPAFETYLDGNATVELETADGNDNGVNQATQLDYLDGNRVYTSAPSQDLDMTIIEIFVDTTIPTRLVHNFPRTHAALCTRHENGVNVAGVAYFDGNIYMVQNTMFKDSSGDGNVDFRNGNASTIPQPLIMNGIDYSTVKTGDTIEGRFAFVFPEFVRLQGNAVDDDITIFFGNRELQDEHKDLSGSIAFSTDEFDYSIRTKHQVRKRGSIYPYQIKAYNDLTYKVLEVTNLLAIKGNALDRLSDGTSTWYRDMYGLTLVVGSSVLIVKSGYDDGTGNIYDATGNVVDLTAKYVSIAYDPDYTGTEYYLYSKALLGDILSTDDGVYIDVPGHEEFRLKGLVLYQGNPYWAVMEYILKDYYKITKLSPVTGDLAKIRNKEIFVAIEFNKQLTT